MCLPSKENKKEFLVCGLAPPPVSSIRMIRHSVTDITDRRSHPHHSLRLPLLSRTTDRWSSVQLGDNGALRQVYSQLCQSRAGFLRLVTDADPAFKVSLSHYIIVLFKVSTCLEASPKARKVSLTQHSKGTRSCHVTTTEINN